MDREVAGFAHGSGTGKRVRDADFGGKGWYSRSSRPLVSLEDIYGLPSEMREWTGQALATRRFDRPEPARRLHMEDFAQVFGQFPESKYENRSYANIAAVLTARAGQEAVADFVRRVMFSALIGNGDMHLKNWSVVYEDSIRPTLSPAYDFVSTIPYIADIADDDLALGFGRSKRLAGFDRRRIERFAQAARLSFGSVLTECRETAERTKEAWREHEPRGFDPQSMDERVTSMIEVVARGTLGGSSPLKRRTAPRKPTM